jgi:acyl dehydratase
MRLDAGQIEVLDADVAEVLRSKTPAERLAIAHGMWRSARGMLLNILRAEHPDWDQAQVEREAARRLSHGTV